MGYRLVKKAYSAVLIQYQRVTDGQTDRRRKDVQPVSITCFSIADARKKLLHAKNLLNPLLTVSCHRDFWSEVRKIGDSPLSQMADIAYAMYKLLYPSIRIRTAPPVSIRVRTRISVSFSLRILFCMCGSLR